MADPERATAPAPATATHSEIENLPALFGRLGDDVMKLLDTKLTLLQVEVKEDANLYVHGAVVMGVGGVIAAVGFALLNIAVAFFVSKAFAFPDPRLNYAMGFVVTGAVYLLIGGGIVMVMKKRLAKRELVPRRSVEELRKDKQWLTKEI
jgi:uncharacterized membrane protein YqjE